MTIVKELEDQNRRLLKIVVDKNLKYVTVTETSAEKR
jgi:hypothetical protein